MTDRAHLLKTLFTTALVSASGCAAVAESREAPLAEIEVLVEQVELGPLQREVPPKPAEKEDEGEDKKDDQPTQEELREKLNQLERELQETRQQFQQRVNEQRQQVEKEAEVDLNTITLPENATREQCEAYLEQLREACKNKRSYSSNDPIVGKLKALPDEHFDLLLSEMTNRSTLRYFANYALREIEPEKMRERFVQTLEQNENNIGVIVMNGWCEDVRPVVIKKINSDDPNITPAWFQAAVELDAPELYPRLHEITINSRYASQFLIMLQSLPDYDLANTINACWARADQGKLPVSKSTFAMMAAEQGNVDALGELVQQLRYSTNYYVSSSTYNPRRTNVLRFIDYRGSNEEIQQWYTDNREKLVFDAFRKRFTLPE